MPPRRTTWSITYDDEELTDLSSDEDADDDQPLVPPPIQTIQVEPQTRPEASTSTSPAHTHAPERSKSTRPSTQSATQKSRERGGLKSFTTNLRPGRNVTYATSSLLAWMRSKTLDLDAEYQRGIVWKEEKQIGLVDSLFHNFHIPPLVFVVTRHPDGSETRVCVDGKQRLTSIRRFMLGEIPYRDPTTNTKYYFTSPAGTRRKTISQAMQNTFKNKQIACFEYEDVTPEQEREIFQRVQMGVALGPAERLAAINGPYADLVRQMRHRIISKPGLEDFLDWGSANGRNFQALAQILYLIVHGTSPSKAEPNHKRLNSFLSQPNPGGNVLPRLEKATMKTLDVLCEIKSHDTLGTPLTEDLSVLEFVMAAYLVHMYHARYSLPQLSDAILQMRATLRKGCSDRKFSSPNFKFVLGFVLKQVPKLTLRTTIGVDDEVSGMNGRILKESRSETPGIPALASVPTPATTKKVVKKRKRDEAETDDGVKDNNNDDEDEDDGYIVPVKKKAITKQKKEAPLTPAPDPSPPKSKLATRTRSASTSKAKTTLKKSPKKGQAAAPTSESSTASALAKRKASSSASTLPGNLQSINNQVAKASSTIRPAVPVHTSSSTFGAAPTPPHSSGSPAPAPPPSIPSVPAAIATQGRLPLPGRTRTVTPASASASTSTSPVMPQPTQPFIAGPSASAPPALGGDSAAVLFDSLGDVDVNADAQNSISPPARLGKGRLAPLRDAKAATAAKSSSSPLLGGSASVAYLNACAGGVGSSGSGSANGGSSSRPGSSSGTGSSKFPKFNKIQQQLQSPIEDSASGSACFAPASPSVQLEPSFTRRSSLQSKSSGSGLGTMVSAQVLVPHTSNASSSNVRNINNGGTGVEGALATPASTPSPVIPQLTLVMNFPPQIPSAASWFGARPPGQGQGQVLYQVPPQAQAAQAQAQAQQAQAQAAAAFTATRDPRSAWRGATVNGNQAQSQDQDVNQVQAQVGGTIPVAGQKRSLSGSARVQDG